MAVASRYYIHKYDCYTDTTSTSSTYTTGPGEWKRTSPKKSKPKRTISVAKPFKIHAGEVLLDSLRHSFDRVNLSSSFIVSSRETLLDALDRDFKRWARV